MVPYREIKKNEKIVFYKILLILSFCTNVVIWKYRQPVMLEKEAMLQVQRHRNLKVNVNKKSENYKKCLSYCKTFMKNF